MGLFDKFQELAAAREALAATGLVPVGAVTERVFSATEGVVNGQRVILAGTNNYLGLTFDPDCLRAAHTALDEQGTGTTGSRLANGNYADHLALGPGRQLLGHDAGTATDVEHTISPQQVCAAVEVGPRASRPTGLPGELRIPIFGHHDLHYPLGCHLNKRHYQERHPSGTTYQMRVHYSCCGQGCQWSRFGTWRLVFGKASFLWYIGVCYVKDDARRLGPPRKTGRAPGCTSHLRTLVPAGACRDLVLASP